MKMSFIEYRKFVKIANESYQFFFLQECLNLCKLCVRYKKKTIYLETFDTWVTSLDITDMEKLLLDIFTLGIGEIFSEVAQIYWVKKFG